MNNALENVRLQFESFWSVYTDVLGNSLISASLPKNITQDAVEFLKRRGKRVRPLLFLLTWVKISNAKAQDKLPDFVLDAAVGLELLHSFVLIHDDVIDRSLTRRGSPTLHMLFSKNFPSAIHSENAAQSLAVVLGDVLFAEALARINHAATNNKSQRLIIPYFLEVVRDTGLGEMLDVHMASGPLKNYVEADVRRMYWLKTTRYTIELPLVLGYLMAGGDEVHLSTLARYAELLGLAFQIRNDLSEIEKSGEDDQSDILHAKKTWLIVRMKDLLDETDRSFLDLCISDHPRDNRLVHKVRLLLEKSGVLPEASQLVESLLQQAAQLLDDSKILPTYKNKIFSVCDDLASIMFS